MSGLRDTLAAWADQRIDEMLAAPRMWGSLEAVEMQVLQLLEIRALAVRPSQELENPRRVLDTYAAFLRERYPMRPADPLFRLIDPGRETEFCDALRSFRATLARTMLVENPFEHSELAIKLTFDTHKPPRPRRSRGTTRSFAERRARRSARVTRRPAARRRTSKAPPTSPSKTPSCRRRTARLARSCSDSAPGSARGTGRPTSAFVMRCRRS